MTHLMSRETVASGAGDNTAENLRRWIKDPAAFKKGALMPAMQMDDAQLGEMVAYLELLDVGYQKHVIDATSRR
jgi:cytochrome c oxidase subunit II